MGRKRSTKSLDGLHRVYWMRNQWQYKSTEDERKAGLKSWERLGVDEAEARLKYAELKNSLGSMGGMNLLFDKFLVEVVSAKRAERTRRDDERYIERLRPVLGHMDPRMILPKHIQQYVDARSKSSPKGARQEYSVLNQLFERSKVWIDLYRNPCEGVKLPKKSKPRARLPEPWEIAEVRRFAQPLLQCYIDFKFATGLDQGVILNLKLSDVLEERMAGFIEHRNPVDVTERNLKPYGIKVMRRKTEVRGLIEWTPDLKRVVIDIFRVRKESNRHCEFLFCSAINNPWNRSTFNNMWQSAKKKALTEGKLAENFTEHDMRASHLAAAEAMGFDGTTQLLHSDTRTTKIYRRSKEVKSIHPVDLQKAIRRHKNK